VIYIDGLKHRKAIWGMDDAAHMISDTSLEELKAFAEQLRMPKYWLQPFPVPHFELSAMWRRRALRAGAIDCAGEDRQEQYVLAIKRYLAFNVYGRPRRAS
jgi:hypothetical protein